MNHPQLLPGWTIPATPSGYDEPVAVDEGVIVREGVFEWRPDFVSWERPGFASQDKSVPATALPSWPWLPGFQPRHNDWLSIGFFPFD